MRVPHLGTPREWRPRALAVALVAAALAGASVACGDGPEATEPTPGGGQAPFQVAITSSDLAVGPQRFAFVALENDTPINNETMYLSFYRVAPNGTATLAGEGPIPWRPLSVLPASEHEGEGHLDTEITGVYYVNLVFDQPGTWGLAVTRGSQPDPAKEVRVSFQVQPASRAPAVGTKAIPVENPTSADAPIKQIDSSPIPDPAFHELSIADALAAGKPAIIAFATPAFCESRTCGPSMEVVTEAWQQNKDVVNVVHVEPYELSPDGELVLDANRQRKIVEAGSAWHLPSEPWVFVVDAQGTIVARFDGPFALEELTIAIAQAKGAG
jgi:hypothetical protein